MKKLTFGALLGGAFAFVAACGGGGNGVDGHINVGSGSDAAALACNPVAQSGCTSGQKCTWIIDQAGSAGGDDLAHIGCAPTGAVALGAACMYGSGGSGATGNDNCVGGTACINGVCETLCDPSSNTGCGSGTACATYVDFYDSSGSDAVAGVCDPTCDPLAQTETLTGSACPTGEGCYGVLGSGETRFSCAGVGSGLDRTPASTADNGPYINTCSPGLIPLFYNDDSGANIVDCSAFCKPGDTYAALPAGSAALAANKNGVVPYNCARAAVMGNTEESCIFAWFIETYDPTDATVTPPASDDADTIGVCQDLPKFGYDPTGGSGTGSALASCDKLKGLYGIADTTAGCTATAQCTDNTTAFGAIDWGCVSFATAKANPPPAGSTLAGKRNLTGARFGYSKDLRKGLPN